MFKRITMIEPTGLPVEAINEIKKLCEEFVEFDTVPSSDEEVARRMQGADAVLLSTTSVINARHIEACPQLKYIGMCCSLYSKESANVDIDAANAKGVVVTGIRDYGDEGVVEYVLSELIRYLHGFGEKQWKEYPVEITNLNVGIIGLGTTGICIGEALQFMGANISYYSRTRKKEYEKKGFVYKELHEMLREVDVAFTCLNKNTILMDKEAFKALGNHKILFNTSIGPGHEVEALRQWLNEGSNEFFCDGIKAIGDESLLTNSHVNCVGKTSGLTQQAFDRMGEKVVSNMREYLNRLNK